MTNKFDEFFPEKKGDEDEYYVDDSGSFPIRRRKKSDGKVKGAKDDDGENVIVII